MRHDMESCDQGGEDQDEAWLDGPFARVKGKSEASKRGTRVMVKLEQDLVLMDRGNGKEQVWSRSMNQYGHVMIRSGSYHFVIGWCMCCINIGGVGMECARQRYNLGHFHFTGHRCVEKFMTGLRIDGHTIKRGKLVCISFI